MLTHMQPRRLFLELVQFKDALFTFDAVTVKGAKGAQALFDSLYNFYVSNVSKTQVHMQ